MLYESVMLQNGQVVQKIVSAILIPQTGAACRYESTRMRGSVCEPARSTR